MTAKEKEGNSGSHGPTTQQDTAKRGRKRGESKKKSGEERENEEREKERANTNPHTHEGPETKTKDKRGCYSSPRTRSLNPTQTRAKTAKTSQRALQNPSRPERGVLIGLERNPLSAAWGGPPLPKNGQERKNLLGPGEVSEVYVVPR